MSTGGIIAIVIITIILIFLLIIGCVWYIRKQNQDDKSIVEGDSELDRTREILRKKYGNSPNANQSSTVVNSYEEVKDMFTTEEILAELKSDNDQAGSYAPVPDWKKG